MSNILPANSPNRTSRTRREQNVQFVRSVRRTYFVPRYVTHFYLFTNTIFEGKTSFDTLKSSSLWPPSLLFLLARIRL